MVCRQSEPSGPKGCTLFCVFRPAPELFSCGVVLVCFNLKQKSTEISRAAKGQRLKRPTHTPQHPEAPSTPWRTHTHTCMHGHTQPCTHATISCCLTPFSLSLTLFFQFEFHCLCVMKRTMIIGSRGDRSIRVYLMWKMWWLQSLTSSPQPTSSMLMVWDSGRSNSISYA